MRKTTGKEVDVGGISIDQLCAQRLGHLTPLPSLELAVDPVISGIDSSSACSGNDGRSLVTSL